MRGGRWWVWGEAGPRHRRPPVQRAAPASARDGVGGVGGVGAGGAETHFVEGFLAAGAGEGGEGGQDGVAQRHGTAGRDGGRRGAASRPPHLITRARALSSQLRRAEETRPGRGGREAATRAQPKFSPGIKGRGGGWSQPERGGAERGRGRHGTARHGRRGLPSPPPPPDRLLLSAGLAVERGPPPSRRLGPWPLRRRVSAPVTLRGPHELRGVSASPGDTEGPGGGGSQAWGH